MPEFGAWFNELPKEGQEVIVAAVRVLRQEGPNLGRPLVDRLKGS